jgi:hypothetical protein
MIFELIPINATYFTELRQAIQSSFSPNPKVVVLESVTDAKAWMHEQTPSLHDHLKAHHFKFVRTKQGTRMFYKEWSTDNIWLPQTGLAILPTEKSAPTQQPLLIRPFYDPESTEKLESTLRKVSLAKSIVKIIHVCPLDWCVPGED